MGHDAQRGAKPGFLRPPPRIFPRSGHHVGGFGVQLVGRRSARRARPEAERLSDPAAPLLEVTGLKTYFFTREGTVQAVDDVSFYVNRGEVLGLVGESGCGKSVTSLSILRLVPYPGRVVDGEIWFGGRNLLELHLDELPAVRGKQIAMIFQQPQSSLNPVYRAGEQIGEAMEIHLDISEEEIDKR